MKGIRFAALLSAALAICLWATTALAEDVPRIAPEELKARLNDPDLVVLDVRAASDWRNSDRKIAGAARPEMDQPASRWSMDLPRDKEYVLYCA